MNPKHVKFIIISMIAFFAVACGTKKEEAHDEASSDQKEWKEMDEFHMIMAETFHPYKDSANLEPVKSRAKELASAAEKWASATLPEKVNNDEMKGKLEELKNETNSLAQTVGTSEDKTIGDQLTKVHDLFHAIQEDWYNAGSEHEHHH